MCNAWNHPPGCACGWGGEGHLGRRPSSGGSLFNEYSYVPPINGTYESYVNPNALCPICKKQVFFYQSPDGGRVFFDELGPPWPKHPCTDGSSIPAKIEGSSTAGKDKRYGWQKRGWEPFFIIGAKKIDRASLRLTGVSSGAEFSVYISRSGVEDEVELGSNFLAQFKRDNGTCSMISIAYLAGEIINTKAYSFSSDVPRGEVRKKIRIQSRELRKRSKANKNVQKKRK